MNKTRSNQPPNQHTRVVRKVVHVQDDSDDDLDMNSRRIETNEDKMEELRGMRDDIPQSDYESHEEIDSKIEESHDRLDYLRERRDELHEDNYCDDDSEDEY